MDPEKQAGPDNFYSGSAYDAEKVDQQPQHKGKLAAIKVLRGVQYATLIVSLAFICCAVDRNILAPGVTADEKALCASVVISLTILLYHMSFLHHSLVAGTLDAVAAVLLFATFVYAAYNSSSGKGVCGGRLKSAIGITAEVAKGWASPLCLLVLRLARSWQVPY
ncbi:hypothetical protein LTR10_006951 [Elasticomyces elasticus]|nr:hypothetical protein LTR10_006951 [Elasticomyces elasticus]KAK4972650.1 hypothetical protein LTR42_005943 [Elasticomyces elasticus]